MIGSKKITDFLKKYIVTILFLVLSLTFILLGDLDMTSVARDLMKRLSRNAFIVLSLIIPIVAGMGINFAITIGAMAAQIGLLLAINWDLTGPVGILVAAAITLPLGALFGYLVGVMLNKMKGQETIGSMILGYFANGAYQLLFLYIFGNFFHFVCVADVAAVVGTKLFQRNTRYICTAECRNFAVAVFAQNKCVHASRINSELFAEQIFKPCRVKHRAGAEHSV